MGIATVVDSFLVDSEFPHPPCHSWVGCQLSALLKLLSASDGGFLFFLHLSRLGRVLGLPCSLAHLDHTCLSFAHFLDSRSMKDLHQADIWGHSFSEDQCMLEELDRCWWFWHHYMWWRPAQKQPLCQRSVVIWTCINRDFMTGVPAMPGNEIL